MNEIKAEYRWMFNYILVHVARTWERIRVEQPHQEMSMDNIQSVDAITYVAKDIFDTDIIQNFLNATDEVKGNDYWDKHTGTMSDCYIEEQAHGKIIKEYVD